MVMANVSNSKEEEYARPESTVQRCCVEARTVPRESCRSGKPSGPVVKQHRLWWNGWLRDTTCTGRSKMQKLNYEATNKLRKFCERREYNSAPDVLKVLKKIESE